MVYFKFHSLAAGANCENLSVGAFEQCTGHDVCTHTAQTVCTNTRGIFLIYGLEKSAFFSV